jgi:hypothetical protein
MWKNKGKFIVFEKLDCLVTCYTDYFIYYVLFFLIKIITSSSFFIFFIFTQFSYFLLINNLIESLTQMMLLETIKFHANEKSFILTVDQNTLTVPYTKS